MLLASSVANDRPHLYISTSGNDRPDLVQRCAAVQGAIRLHHLVVNQHPVRLHTMDELSYSMVTGNDGSSQDSLPSIVTASVVTRSTWYQGPSTLSGSVIQSRARRRLTCTACDAGWREEADGSTTSEASGTTSCVARSRRSRQHYGCPRGADGATEVGEPARESRERPLDAVRIRSSCASSRAHGRQPQRVRPLSRPGAGGRETRLTSSSPD